MGVLNFEHERKHLTCIKRPLARRGLKPDLDEEWEIHGPHQEMNYQTYVGYAVPADKQEKCQAFGCNLAWSKCKTHDNSTCVAIYPRAVYEIDEPSDWYKNYPEKRIPILSK